MRTCSVEGCTGRHEARGFCVTHYTRLIRHGDPNRRVVARGDARKFFEAAAQSDSSECIEWPFTTTGSDKRPWINYKGEKGIATRIMCKNVHGDPPQSEMHAAHSCGNKKCINPQHLRWATAKENAADKIIHGRAPRGENQGSSKLKEWQVLEMRANIDSLSTRQLSEKYGVSRNHVLRILNREQWAHNGLPEQSS